jgi:hypothetical protein
VIALASYPVGTVLNTYGEDLPSGWFARQGLKIVYGQIRGHQRRVWPDKPRTQTSAIHSQIKVYSQEGKPGLWLSCTTPRTVLHEPNIEGIRARAFRWEGLGLFGAESWNRFEGYCKKLIGTPYDYGQLLDIAITDWFSWIPDKLPIFDMGRGRKVCSVACMGALCAGRQGLPACPPSDRSDFPKPNQRRDGSVMYLEHVPPAFFECEPRHQLIGEQGFGA